MTNGEPKSRSRRDGRGGVVCVYYQTNSEEEWGKEETGEEGDDEEEGKIEKAVGQ